MYLFPSIPSRRISRQATRDQRRSLLNAAVQVTIEALENRCMLSTVSWNVGISGQWTTASNWLDDVGVARVPTSDDDVIINPAATVTVTIAGAQAAKSVTVTGDDTLSLLNSSLSLVAASTISRLTLTGTGAVSTSGDLTLSGTTSMADQSVLAGPGKIFNTGGH